MYLCPGILIYQKSENRAYLQSIVYRMYTWALAIVFRLGPTLLLAYLNLRIMVAYRRTCSNRRRMTGKTIINLELNYNIFNT